MNFERRFLATSYALVGVAFFAVAASGQIGIVAPVGFVVAYVASLLWRHDDVPRPRTAQIWTAALLASFLGLVIWSIDDGNWLLHALEFALLMTVSRLFQRRHAKDWLQLYALSFLLILVAAVIHPTLTFAVSFVIYAVLAIWSLVMLHIVRQIEIATHSGPEDDPAEKAKPSLTPRRILDVFQPWRWRRKPLPPATIEEMPDGPVSPETLSWRQRELVRGSFLFATSVMAILVLAASMLFFFLFPRIGLGFFFARTRGGQAVTGFAEQVELGGFGRIKTSSEVVMRVVFPEDPDRLDEPIRLRGMSFDHFDGRNWSRSEEPNWTLHRLGQRHELPGAEPPKADEISWKARIYLEPLDIETRVLFHPAGTQSIEFVDSQYDGMRGRRKRVEIGMSRDLTYRAPKEAALSYIVEVVEPRSESARRKVLTEAAGETPRWVTDRWLQLPPNLDPRFGRLASELMVGGNLTERVLALEAGLRRGWTYSLEGDQDNAAPLEDFLFGIKHGHCEYFATSMAVLLRTQGVPARIVNGYLGGERNDFGDYRMIKQGDAHAWVEVYFAGAGWQTFDPTPASGQFAPLVAGIAAAMRRLADSATLAWYTWIVEYDLERQVDVFRSIGRTLRELTGGFRLSPRNAAGLRRIDQPDAASDAESGPGDGSAPWWPYLAGALVFIGAGGYMWRRRRDAALIFDVAIAREVSALERELAALGFAREPWQTWSVVAERTQAVEPALASAIAAFARSWDLARWRDPLDQQARSAALASARDAVRMGRALRRAAA